MLTAVADTNIYISAFLFGGAPEFFLRLAEAGAFQLAISDAIRDEFARVLQKKFGWSTRRVDEVMQQLARLTWVSILIRH